VLAVCGGQLDLSNARKSIVFGGIDALSRNVRHEPLSLAEKACAPACLLLAQSRSDAPLGSSAGFDRKDDEICAAVDIGTHQVYRRRR
jgi:hypothetical protein